MYVNLDAKAVYLAHPRTASRAVRDVIQKCGFKGNTAVPFPIGGPGGHHQRIAGPPPEGWSVATTVRHHFDMIASWLFNTRWRRVAQKRMLLEDALKDFDMADYLERDIHGTRATYYPKRDELLAHVQYANRIITYTHLEDDLKSWLTDCLGEAPEPFVVPVVGNVPRRGIKCDDVFDDKMKAAIIERYRREMTEWGFLVDGKAVGYQ